MKKLRVQDLQDMPEHWVRLSAVIEQAGMSTNYFAHHIGLPVAETLYRVKRGQNGISRDVAERIVDKFPNISKGWLLTGEGSMYYNDNRYSSQVPYYEKYIEEVLSGRRVAPVCYLSIPIAEGCDYAIKFNDGSQTLDDNILLLAEVPKEKLADGKEYLFLIKKSLSLQRWNAGLRFELGDDDRAFAVKGRLSICKEY